MLLKWEIVSSQIDQPKKGWQTIAGISKKVWCAQLLQVIFAKSTANTDFQQVEWPTKNRPCISSPNLHVFFLFLRRVACRQYPNHQCEDVAARHPERDSPWIPKMKPGGCLTIETSSPTFSMRNHQVSSGAHCFFWSSWPTWSTIDS